MKALFFTDVHASEAALDWVRKKGRAFDAVIVGGDLAKGEDRGFSERFLAAALGSNPRVFYVPGNADRPSTAIPEGVVQLHGRTVRFGNLTMGGLGGSNPTPFNTPFELPDKEASRILGTLGRVDILVSHCPPAGTRCDRASGVHVGSAPVRSYVLSKKPQLVLSGHVHDSRAVDNMEGTTVVNAGPLMEGRYAEVTLGGVISVELKAEALPGTAN